MKSFIKGLQISINIIFLIILLFFLFNFFLGFIWEIRTNLKFKNFKPYDDVVLKALNLSEKDGLDLYLETFINRKFEYEQFTEHAENNGFNNKFVNVTPDLGRKTISPEICNQNIFLYGGSTTFGYNVTDNQTIASYFGQILIDKDLKICVKNFGRGSYFSTQENILFQKHILNKKISKNDIILFIDGINENGNRNSRNTGFLFQSMKTVNQNYWDMYKFTFPVFFESLAINQFINRLKKKLNLVSKHKHFQQNIFDVQDNITDVYQKNILFRKGICTELELNCYSFLQPFATIHGKYFDKPVAGAIEVRILNIEENIKLKKKYNMIKNTKHIIDISDSLNEMNMLSYIDGVHYSPQANKIIAQEIFNTVEYKFYE